MTYNKDMVSNAGKGKSMGVTLVGGRDLDRDLVDIMAFDLVH